MGTRNDNEQTELESIRSDPGNCWLDEIFDSKWYHEDWRSRAVECEGIYRNDDYEEEKYNVLWSNTEILRPLLFSSIPTAEATPWSDEPNLAVNVTGKILEKAINYSNNQTHYNLEGQGARVVIDYLVAGRGQARAFYEAEFEPQKVGEEYNPDTDKVEDVLEDKKISERVYIRHYNWRNYLHSRSKRWEDVWWVAFGHDMNRDDLVENFGEVGREIPLVGDWNRERYNNWKDDPNTRSGKKSNFAKVWEIWSKREKKVIFVAEGYDEIIKETDDPYELKEFYPCPEALYSIKTTDSLVPIPEFTQYQYQARELDILTRRINWLTDALRVRGIADNSVKAFKKLFTAEDNEVILDDDYARLAAAGGMDNAVSWVPLGPIATALEVLVKRREDALRVIYQITGLSDIMSGANNPYESAEAVQKKDKWGSTRIWERQKDVNRFFRDLIAIEGELIADKFDPATLIVISGVEDDEIKLAGMEEVKTLLESDRLRDFKISIQSDKTIDPYEREKRAEVMEFMPLLASFLQAGSVAVDSGAITTTALHELTLRFVQRFDFGRDNMYIIEQAIKDSAEQSAQQQKQQQELLMAEMQFKQKTVEAQLLMAQAEMAKSQVNAKRYEMEYQVELEQIKVKWAELSQKTSSDEANRQIKLIEASIKSNTALNQVKESNKNKEETVDA